ncbi:transporter substrate-binding domain-containing protein [Anaeromyxobacter paludicola]|uniref:Amino acid ABC transporter substrate-binding protein n=1 Tax=Anaeromyxobacter paludicola TaxID=2918171 RepID=A0ABM7XDD1_9BACT|nr:transporter substrate-binding domain-containing protein [Anaeromyxobacter paludicola]BDG09843.1 amino acid ABC transporter substrate-binding protein [Anaeromyxobacter paludicola]
MRTLKTALLAAVLLAAGAARAAPPLTVGTEGTYAPFTFFDQAKNLTGYDVEVMKEVGKRAGYDVKFVPTPWDSMFLALESRKFDLIANQIAKTPEREKKYAFTAPYLVSGAQIIVRGDRKDIHGLDDLRGKRVGTGVGSNYTKLLEEYNKTHSPKIELKYYEGNLPVVLQDIAAGRLDATVNDRLTAGYNAKQLKIDVKLVGEPIELVPSHFVVRKDAAGEAVAKKVDQALASLRQDGTLEKLSKSWFGADYTK